MYDVVLFGKEGGGGLKTETLYYQTPRESGMVLFDRKRWKHLQDVNCYNNRQNLSLACNVVFFHYMLS